MNAAVLDTLRCAQTLKNAGFTQEQSEATAQVLGDALADVATKADLDRLESKFENKLDAMDEKFETKIDAMDQKFEAKIDAMEQKLDAVEQTVETKLDATEQKVGELEEKFVVRFDAVDKALKFNERLLLVIVGAILTAVLTFALQVAAQFLSRSDPTPVTPTTAESPASTPGNHAVRAQTSIEAQPFEGQDTPEAPPGNL